MDVIDFYLTDALRKKARPNFLFYSRLIFSFCMILPFLLLFMLNGDFKLLGFVVLFVCFGLFLVWNDLVFLKKISKDKSIGKAYLIRGRVEGLSQETLVIERSNYIRIRREVVLGEHSFKISKKFYKKIRIGDSIELLVLPESGLVIEEKLIKSASKPTSIFDFSQNKSVTKNHIGNSRF